MAKIKDKSIEKAKNYLVQEKIRLEEEIASMRDYPNFGIGEDDSAMEMAVFHNQLGLAQNLDKLLKEVKSALQKIDEGKYGICEDCKKPIEPARLEISPSTKYCASCAGKNHKNHKK